MLLGRRFRLANNRSPAEAFAGIPNKQAHDRLEIKRFIDKHGLTAFRFHPHFPVNTLKLMRGACAAQVPDCFEPCVEAMDAAMQTARQAAGLDGAAIVATSQDPAVKAMLLANTQSADERGAFGSPTFLVGGDIYFGKDRLCDVEEQIVQLQRT